MNEHNIKLAKDLCAILSHKRACDYTCLKQIGFTLKAIDESLFDDFIKYSKDSKKFDEDPTICQQIWNIAENHKEFYSIETLKHWAKLDNPEEYYKILFEMNSDKFDKAKIHTDISQIIYEIYKGYFVCTNISRNRWYKFSDHRWKFLESKDVDVSQELISNEFLKIIRTYYPEKKIACKDNPDNYTEYVNKFTKIMDKLHSINFRNKVVKECANLFYKNDFESKLDSNAYLVGFTNGIFDLKEMYFRDGLPSDYVSKIVRYSWKYYTENDPVLTDINNFISKIQPDNDMKQYLLTFMARVLRGEQDNKIHIWCGKDNNSSIVIELIKQMLGDYFGFLPVETITRKRRSSAIPELTDKQGKKFLVIQNPDDGNININFGIMKELVGGDMIIGKPLYGDPYIYKQQFTMVYACNTLPHIPSQDYGVWRRLSVMPFESELDDLNDLNISNLVQPIMWLIITKYYPIFEKGINGNKYKIMEPDKVTQFTKNYKLDSDVYVEFLNETIITTNNNNDIMDIPSLFNTFKQWYRACYVDKPPARKNLAEYLIKNNYVINDGKIYGVKLSVDIM